MQTTGTLADVSLFQDFSAEDLKTLEAHAKIRQFKKNTVVINVGDETDSMYVILRGRVRIFLDDEQGNELTILILGPGGSFGELALLSGDPRTASVMTTEETQLLIISKHQLMEYITANPAISFRIIESLIKRIQTMTEDISSLALLDVYGRVARVLQTHSKEENGRLITERLTHQEIANMVGASREMVSRILKDLRSGGYVSTDDKRIILEKPLPAGW